jgi:hypothetical protein
MCGIAIALILQALIRTDRVTPESYEKIGRCMTRQQVIEALGRTSLGKGPEADPTYLPCFFTTHTGYMRNNGELWRHGEFRIWVVFDEQDRVTGWMCEKPSQFPSTPSSPLP